jgi:uncharacterized RDD family membrane protein YckC
MNEAGGAWRWRSDEDLVEAATHLDEYTEEGHRVIRAELLRRGLAEPPSAFEYRPAELPPRGDEAPALASLSDRLGGQVVDSVIAIVIVGISALPSLASEQVGRATLLGGFMAGLSYLLFSDGLPGQSYGHRVTHTAVVHATTGEPCTFRQSFVRNLLLSALGVVDWVFIFGKRRQRLGDMAARTIVINLPAPSQEPARKD